MLGVLVEFNSSGRECLSIILFVPYASFFFFSVYVFSLFLFSYFHYIGGTRWSHQLRLMQNYTCLIKNGLKTCLQLLIQVILCSLFSLMGHNRGRKMCMALKHLFTCFPCCVRPPSCQGQFLPILGDR